MEHKQGYYFRIFLGNRCCLLFDFFKFPFLSVLVVDVFEGQPYFGEQDDSWAAKKIKVITVKVYKKYFWVENFMSYDLILIYIKQGIVE